MTMCSTPEILPSGDIVFLPTRQVIWGPGSIARLPEALDSLPSADRVLLLTSQSLAKEATLVGRVRQHVRDRLVGQFEHLPAHVPGSAVDAATAIARTTHADTVLAFGGGSVIDAAKAVLAGLAELHGRSASLIAVPTTLSGAEFADHYGVTERCDGREVKYTHSRREVTPAVVILDAQLTAATPEWLWAGSAVKALDHAIEGILCDPTRPVVSKLAEAGIAALTTVIHSSLDPEEHGARQACQIAAWYCYFAPASVTLGLSHRVGHVLGGTYGVPHAYTSGLTLPAIVRVMNEAAPMRVASITRALEADVSCSAAPERLARMHATRPADVLLRLVKDLGLPTRLRDVGILRADLDAITRQVSESYPAAVAQLAATRFSLRALLSSVW